MPFIHFNKYVTFEFIIDLTIKFDHFCKSDATKSVLSLKNTFPGF